MVQAPFTVMKIGGELLEAPADLRSVVSHIGTAAAASPLVVVHGGGRELSAELARRGSTPAMVDGIRVTDDTALDAAVSVLGGTINTRLVAALIGAGVRAVGLTGVDAGLLRARRAPRMRSRAGHLVDLGRVGLPAPNADAGLLRTLARDGWVPIVASLGVTAEGEILNVNADVAASHLAIVLHAGRLLVLGATDGVLDASGEPLAQLSHQEAEALIDSGAARDGMAAKLEACVRASACGVAEVRILNGRARSIEAEAASGTRIGATGVARAS
jgi:acetylglutamate kinase